MKEESTSSPTLVAIAIVEREGDVLIGLRPPGVPLAGYWEFPGGKVNGEEQPVEAACRECLEETGLRVDVVGEYTPCRFAYDHGDVDLRFFRCVVRGEMTAKPPFQWVSKNELSQYRFPPANASVLQQLKADL